MRIRTLDLGQFETGDGKIAANRLAGKYMSRDIDWRTIWSGAAGFLALMAVYAWGMTLEPIWQKALLGLTVQTWIILFCFNISHEIAHDMVFKRRPDYRRLNTIFGYFMATPTLTPYHSFRDTHLAHHRSVNDPMDDPNHWVVRGSLPYVVFKVVTIIVGDHLVLSRFVREQADRKHLRYYVGFLAASFCALALLGVMTGWANMLFFWLLPACANYAFVFAAVAVIPHRQSPDAPEPQVMKIVILPPGLQEVSTMLHASHNYHLLHHLYPRVPSYHYPTLATELLALQENPARIEALAQDRANPFAARAEQAPVRAPETAPAADTRAAG